MWPRVSYVTFYEDRQSSSFILLDYIPQKDFNGLHMKFVAALKILSGF